MPKSRSAARAAAAIRGATAAVLIVAAAASASPAIEMFTFFGDGSRIGLPSLEVPIEAYRGIPLRSDRLRADRGARKQPSGLRYPASRTGQTGLPRGITIRPQPEAALPPLPQR